MNGARHETVEAYKKEIDNNRNDIRPPTNGAVFYTNNGRDKAREHVAEQRARGKDTLILEQTEHGKKLDSDRLFDRSDPRTNQLELNEAKRINQETGKVSLNKHNAATKVWDHESKTYGEQATGRVTVVTNDRAIKENSFFARNEREALIRNEKVTHINGVERKELQAKLDAVDHAKSREANAMTAAQRERAKSEHNEALRDLNGVIERNDPTRDKAKEKTEPIVERKSAFEKRQESKTTVDSAPPTKKK
ncbi:hypothetical protein [uncultured Roseobacter sp.]|uniref:hypothetical protein n=1 Tax=uncultured Roseobacter sp. TaxID=114847 RepID=UPI00262A1F7B|nr:hypothetical protein [uncultured Roseobacter sp.]